jgi:mRNA interferase MazF
MKQVFDVPERGDVVLISFPAIAGRAGAGPRPAVVLSPQAYNGRVGLALLCPVVTELKGYPFEVRLPDDLPVQGAVLADQATCLDWRALRAERVCALPSEALEEILGKLREILR